MSISYKKLFKLLIDRGLKRKDLQEAIGISSATVTKLSNNECTFDSIMEVVPDENVG